HDVNNALNPIMAAAYLLEMNAENPAAVRDYAVRIARAAETGAATAARVGRVIRQEALLGSREDVVDLSVMVEEVVAMTRPMWQEGAKGGVVALEHRLAADVTIARSAGGAAPRVSSASPPASGCAASPASCARRCSTWCRTRSTRCPAGARCEL